MQASVWTRKARTAMPSLGRGDPKDGARPCPFEWLSGTWLIVGVVLRLSEEGGHLGLTGSSLDVTWGGLSHGNECGIFYGSRGYLRPTGTAVSGGWGLESLGRAEHGKAVAMALRVCE